MNKYSDMLNMEHPRSKRHIPMPLADRAAQFSPFAALTGYEEVIEETARLTDDKIELEEDTKNELDQKMSELLNMERNGISPVLKITYFIEDKRKDGGSYTTVQGELVRINLVKKIITISPQEDVLLTIKVSDISGIEKL